MHASDKATHTTSVAEREPKEELLSLTQLCQELAISSATGKNWEKLGKITADRAPFYSRGYVDTLKKNIQSGVNTALKSRRNKKYVSGNTIYKSYIDPASPNLEPVSKLFGLLEGARLDLTTETMTLLLAECALQLICQCEKLPFPHRENLLRAYLHGKLEIGAYARLIDDLLHGTEDQTGFVSEQQLLFRIAYKYRENEDILGLLYISLKDIRDRKATGSYYTPTAIVTQMMQELFRKEPAPAPTLDPCCGTGNFLLQLPSSFTMAQIYGEDLDLLSIRIARLNLAMKFHLTDYELLCSHLVCGNYLIRQDNALPDMTYDYIIGNPPWGYDFSTAEAEDLRFCYHSAAGKSIESYDVFIEQGLSQLRPMGTLAFVLPEALLNVRSHTAVRSLILEDHSISSLTYLGNAFDQVQCPCILLQVVRTGQPFSCIGMRVHDGKEHFTIALERSCSADCFSFHMTDEEYCIIRKMETAPGCTTLTGHADFALGIVTGNNKKYVSEIRTIGTEGILKGSDLRKYRCLPASHYITYLPELFQQVASDAYYRAPEKLLYRFISESLVFAYDDQQTLSLNSCNILIPHVAGLPVKYILAVLNSRPVQFYYSRVFRSVKVLRASLEHLPIPVAQEPVRTEITALSGQLIDLMNDTVRDRSALLETYSALDRLIAALFGLTEKEYDSLCEILPDHEVFL